MKDETSVRTNPEGMITPIDFTTFMRNYQDMVFSTAVRLVGNVAQAQDISQEVFLKAYQHFDRLETSPTAGGWLKKVATNLSLNHLTRYRNRWRFFSEFKRTGADQNDTAETEIEFADQDHFLNEIDSDERKAWLATALEELPDHQRVPLVLYHFENMPYDEIAKQLRVSQLIPCRNPIQRISKNSFMIACAHCQSVARRVRLRLMCGQRFKRSSHCLGGDNLSLIGPWRLAWDSSRSPGSWRLP